MENILKELIDRVGRIESLLERILEDLLKDDLSEESDSELLSPN